MTQISMIYNQEQWNQLIQQLRVENQSSIQEVMLPLNNIQQKNPINIQNKTMFRLDKEIIEGIPQNIQFNFNNKGFFNNFNSNLSFNIPIRISNLPQPKDGNPDNPFDFTFKSVGHLGEKSATYTSNQYQLLYKIVLYNNYICLQVHTEGENKETSNTLESKGEILIRLYKIPPSPAAYLSDVLLQHNNKKHGAFNSQYKDIWRKQTINSQIIQQDFTDFLQQQYAYVSHNQDQTLVLVKDDDTENKIEQNNFTSNTDKIKVLAEYLSTTQKPLTEITYNYQVSIPLVYFHPFFQLAYNTPIELLNSQLSMIFNFNLPIFTACYAYQKKTTTDPTTKIFEDMINVQFTGINDMKIILYKDTLMKYNTIEQSKNGVYYLIYRNSDYAQYQNYDKYGNIVLQNVLPKLESLDMIQLCFFDRKSYALYKDTTDGNRLYKMKQINNMDYYLGYSSLFNEQLYSNHQMKTYEYVTIDGANYRYLLDYSNYSLNTNYRIIGDDSDTKIPLITVGDVQISIQDQNIIPYTYQTLEDIYKTNISLYDVNDNKFSPNAHWDYPYYLKYFNSYMWKFDQKYGEKQKLLQPQFRGLKINDAKSNIFMRLYSYNTNGTPAGPLEYNQFDPSLHENSFFNSNQNKYLSTDKCWINQQVSVEFIYYYSSLFKIIQGDIIQIDDQDVRGILDTTPMYNETEYKIAASIPLIKQHIKQDMRQIRPKAQENVSQQQEQQIEAQPQDALSQQPQQQTQSQELVK